MYRNSDEHEIHHSLKLCYIPRHPQLGILNANFIKAEKASKIVKVFLN